MLRQKKISKFLDKNRQIKLVKLLFPCYYEHRNLKQQTASKIKEDVRENEGNNTGRTSADFTGR